SNFAMPWRTFRLAYSSLAKKLRGSDDGGKYVLSAIREAITETPELRFSDNTGRMVPTERPGQLVATYRVVAKNLDEGDVRAAAELIPLRNAFGKPADSIRLWTLAELYSAAAGKLTTNAPDAVAEVAAIREAIVKATDPDELGALTLMYAGRCSVEILSCN